MSEVPTTSWEVDENAGPSGMEKTEDVSCGTGVEEGLRMEIFKSRPTSQREG